MKNRKTIVLLLLLIAALVATEALLDVVGAQTRHATRTTLADDAADATALVLARRGEAPTHLERDADATWRMTHPFVSSVETPVVLRLLDTLAHTTVEESISDAELLRLGRTRADYALEDPPLRIRLSNDVHVASLAFGLLTPSGDGVYAAIDGERDVLIVPSAVLAAIDMPVEKIRRRRLLSYDASSVAAFDVKQPPDDLLAFTRNGEGWFLDDDKAATDRVTAFLNAVTSAEAIAFVWPTGATNESRQASAALLAGYGLDPETAVTVTLKRPGGLSSSISLGRSAGEKTVYALVHNGGSVVTVPASLKATAKQGKAWFSDTRLFQTTAEKVASIAFVDGDSRVSLVRVGEIDWRIDAPIDAPADAAEVSALLARLLALTSADLDAKGVSVALNGDAKPLVVAREKLFPSDDGFAALRAKAIVSLARTDVKRLVATHADGTSAAVVYAKDRRVWNVESAPDGAVASVDDVEQILYRLAPLSALRVVRLKATTDELPSFGLDKPSLRLAIDLDRDDAVRRNILVGAETSDGGRYATVGSADAVFVISRETFETLTRPLVRKDSSAKENQDAL